MKIIVCADDRNGMVFNHRRQSMDRKLYERIIRLVGDQTLKMDPRSVTLFKEAGAKHLVEDTDFLSDSGKDDYCFVEFAALKPWEEQIEEVIVCRWNRVYPADQYLDLNLEEWKLCETEEMEGSSHACITLEVYRR